MQARTLSDIDCRMLDLAANQHVGTFREILPFAMAQPAANFSDPANAQNREYLRQVMSLYAGYNLRVVLSFDRPLPPWAAASPWCPLPSLGDSAGWASLKNTLSYLIGDLVAWLVDPAGGALSPTWVASHLFVEPWNEFDNVADSSCQAPSTAPSPARAADLAGGVNFVLQHAGFLPTTMPTLVTPSVTGSYPGQPWGPYLAAYYAAGGVGLPSMHYYTCDVGTLEAGVAQVAKVLPAPLQSSILLGETGCPLQTATCTTGSSEDTRTSFLVGAAQSKILQSLCHSVLFWRVMALTDPGQGCEGTFGVATADDSGYDAAGAALFVAIGGSGSSTVCPSP